MFAKCYFLIHIVGSFLPKSSMPPLNNNTCIAFGTYPSCPDLIYNSTSSKFIHDSALMPHFALDSMGGALKFTICAHA